MKKDRLGWKLGLTCVILMILATLAAGCGSDEGDPVTDDSSGSTTAPSGTGDSSSNQPTTTGQGNTGSSTTTPSSTPSAGTTTIADLLVGLTLVGDAAARDLFMQDCIKQGRAPNWMTDEKGQYWMECCPTGQKVVFNYPDRGRCKP